jgi:hypothetical protein
MHHPRKIVLRITIEQTNLHIHHNHCIHGQFPEINHFKKSVTSNATLLNR